MKKTNHLPRGGSSKMGIMKISLFLIIAGLFQIQASSYSQTITLSGKRVKLQDVLQEVEKQTGYVVFGDRALLHKSAPVMVAAKNTPLKDFLNQVFQQQSLDYEIRHNTIVLLNKKPTTNSKTSVAVQEGITITGRIHNENGSPLSNVNIKVRKSNQQGVTDANGVFMLIDLEKDAVINVSSLGYQTMNIPVNELITLKSNESKSIGKGAIQKHEQHYIIQLANEEMAVDEVVVTGIVERKKESFTGATNSFTGQELLQVGNVNVIQSLKTLDPSFLVVENAMFGSDPNRLSNIEIRGRSSFTSADLETTYGTNPNLPLFVLDGFESDLRTITDISIHRIARITLLKDAASTALYGSRAANGVVVVETKQPTLGRIEISYSSDLLVNSPFLNDYNLMNAAEKLEFERLSGQFNSSGFLNSAMLTEADYYSRLAEVKSGVDTYWLSEPLRTGFTHGHNVNFTGGSNELRFNAGLSYKQDQGVMKGSNRDTYRGSLSLTYRKNKININNQLFISGFNAQESPYGAFSNFSLAVPYYQKRNAIGEIPRYLNLFQDSKLAQGRGVDSIPNPLYLAQIGNRNDTKSFGFTNNLQANYDFTPSLRLSGSLSLTKGTQENILFKPAENPEYDQKIAEEKGLYRNGRTDNNAYQGSLMLTYAKVFGERHSLTTNLRAEIQENKYNTVGFSATGFSSLSNGNPNVSSGYLPYSRPNGTVLISRRNNILASVNYMLDSKYLFDFSYRYDGSTAFGAAKRYSPFWSTGLGWNLHKEQALADMGSLDLLKIRGSIGYTGNQQFGQVLSVNVYQQLAGQTIFGEMSDLLALGNPNLEWQRTQNLSLGVDYGIWDSRLNGYFNWYRNHSSPLVVPIAQAPSSGVKEYFENAGELTYQGIEAKANFGLIYRPEDRIVWNISMTLAHNKGTYSGFGGKLNNLNEAQREANSYTRYFDGNSPENIWAVKSAGIDPLTGKEVFIKKDGNQTFEYSALDEVVMGSTRPVLEGVTGTNVTFKGFTAGIYLRYSWKSDLLNTALYNKVENLSASDIRMNNLDKRALYGRWKEPGDIAAFKSISDNSFTPISSRFIQKQSFLAGESLNVSYRFLNQNWLKSAGLQSLIISGYSNDIFRWSTVKNERGLEYPFASSFSLNINATF
ncbi:TonB-linked outer membrane protein, SusC/RagA family [Sphingobacterium nematocida]|uniref:TonB-linked outer membrane protein, SusC/RagA family n=1 Tax=Sphingobacterium nematocida TaxID=1513896 RepID=A0A1T5AUL7_9SPHI|nr:SusC/RagA family TonB-linked outer membrane protein [Sphingobacterium nematocida]SKB38682.1 TonB-linked outer membrane protein, SusC/RagA family [Sphingobacterium nematocida]